MPYSTENISLSTVFPEGHKMASLREFKAVVFHDYDTDAYRVIENPRTLYVGQNGVTVRGQNPKDTVRFGRNSDIIDAYPRGWCS